MPFLQFGKSKKLRACAEEDIREIDLYSSSSSRALHFPTIISYEHRSSSLADWQWQLRMRCQLPLPPTHPSTAAKLTLSVRLYLLLLASFSSIYEAQAKTRSGTTTRTRLVFVRVCLSNPIPIPLSPFRPPMHTSYCSIVVPSLLL